MCLLVYTAKGSKGGKGKAAAKADTDDEDADTAGGDAADEPEYEHTPYQE